MCQLSVSFSFCFEKERHSYYLRQYIVYQGFRDTNIGQHIIEDCTPRILLFRSEFQCLDTQIKYKFYQTKSFIVLYCLNSSIFVHTFLLFRSHQGAAEITCPFKKPGFRALCHIGTMPQFF